MTETIMYVPIKLKWTEQKIKLKYNFPNLTDNDLNFEEHKSDEMFGRLETKLGKTKEELNAVSINL